MALLQVEDASRQFASQSLDRQTFARLNASVLECANDALLGYLRLVVLLA